MSTKFLDTIKKIVVETVDTEFYVSTESDDSGVHYMIYIPHLTNTDALRKSLDKIKLDKRYIIAFVPEGYIEVFLRE